MKYQPKKIQFTPLCHIYQNWQDRTNSGDDDDDDELGIYLLCLTAATRSGPENMENRLSPLAEDVSSLELAESPWFAVQLLFTASLRTKPGEVLPPTMCYQKACNSSDVFLDVFTPRLDRNWDVFASWWFVGLGDITPSLHIIKQVLQQLSFLTVLKWKSFS